MIFLTRTDAIVIDTYPIESVSTIIWGITPPLLDSCQGSHFGGERQVELDDEPCFSKVTQRRHQQNRSPNGGIGVFHPVVKSSDESCRVLERKTKEYHRMVLNRMEIILNFSVSMFTWSLWVQYNSKGK